MTEKEMLEVAVKIGDAHAQTVIKFALRIRRLRRAMIGAIMSLRAGRPDSARRKLEDAINAD